jgi:hypothetical protein
MLRAHPHFLLCKHRSVHGLTLALDIALPGLSGCQRESEEKGEREIKREGDGEGERKRKREKDVEYGCFVFIFNRNGGYIGTF